MTPQMHVRCTSTHVSKTAEPSFGGGDVVDTTARGWIIVSNQLGTESQCEDKRSHGLSDGNLVISVCLPAPSLLASPSAHSRSESKAFNTVHRALPQSAPLDEK